MNKSLIIGIASAGLLVGPAIAADLPVKAPAAVVAATAYNWTGFYVGGNVGYSWGNSSNSWNFFAPNFTGNTICPPAGGALCANGSDSNKLNGGVGGLQAGYNWQSGLFLAGVEADLQASGQKRSNVFNTNIFNVLGGVGTLSAAHSEALPWFGTARGRLGLVAERWLFFVTGGLAYGRVTVDGSATATPTPALLASWSNGVTKAGWTIGGGVEAMITGNWSVKAEYLYVDLGTVNTKFATLPGCYGNLASCSNVVAGSGAISSHVTDNILRVGFNYRFGGPVVAKY